MLWYSVCVCVGGGDVMILCVGAEGGGGCYDAVNKAKILFPPDDTICG